MIKLSGLDKLIAWFSPQTGFERASYKAAIVEATRDYEGAKVGRRTAGWLTRGSSANAELTGAIQTLRDRSRDLGRNNWMVSRVYGLLPGKICGKGVTPRLNGVSQRMERAHSDAWGEFSIGCSHDGELDWPALQRLIMRCVIESGEALMVRDVVNGRLCIKALEPDYIDATRTEVGNSGNYIWRGIEFDANDRRVAYWLYPSHPGDSAMIAASSKKEIRSVRVPAKDIVSVYQHLRLGQHAGVPWCTPVLMKIRDVDDLDDANIVRKRVQACLSAFVHRTTGQIGSAVDGNAKVENGERFEHLSPAKIFYLAPGEDVSFAAPPASGAGEADAMIAQWHAIAAGIQSTYSMATGDLRQVNYSSMRAGLLDFWTLLDGWQTDILVPRICRPVWRWWNDLREVQGGKPFPETSVVWDLPLRPFIDPTKDGEAEKAAIRDGRKTLYESLAERGKDPELHLQEIAKANAQLDALKIVLDTDPRQDVGGAVQSASTSASDNQDTTNE